MDELKSFKKALLILEMTVGQSQACEHFTEKDGDERTFNADDG